MSGMRNNLPAFRDLSPSLGENLDEKLAAEHFLGKTLREAENLFRENAIHYAGDLMWMGDAAFAFYFMAFSRYLKSSHADGDSDALNSLASIIAFRVEHEPKSIVGVRRDVLSVLSYCVDHFPKFAVNEAIYKDLRDKLVQLQKDVAALNASARLKD